MKLTIDNLDGHGPIDYTTALDRSSPFELERTLNAPSIARGQLCLAATTLITPVRRARITISSTAGALLFTGYLATEPAAIYAGVASQGPVYRLSFAAISDEWLLDKQAWGSESGVALAGTSAAVVQTLANRLAAGVLTTAGLGSGGAPLGVFEPPPNSTWSTQAGAAAGATYSSYRALNGALSLTPAAATVHTLSDGAGTLSIAALETSKVRELANDVTVSGAMEPTAYWTEFFYGDGTTTAFDLLGQPDAPAAGKLTYIADSFNQSTLNLQTWQLTDPGSHLSLSSGGLTMTGGNGFDGQTTLTAYNPIELGGTTVIELDTVALTGASTGGLGGLYMGATLQANCFAGFNVTQSGGNTIVTPLVNGVATGTPFTLVSGHIYTLRLHLHCPELLRVKQAYYAFNGTSVQSFGGGLVTAPISLLFEIRDNGASSNTPVTILYDGAVTTSPAQCNFVAVNSIQLFGSVGSIEVTRTGSAWIQTTDPTSGITSTRVIGTAAAGADCSITSSVTGKVTFFPGRVPIAGEIVTVLYRGSYRAVSRVADAASIATEAAGGSTIASAGTARWIGHVVRPLARSSEDCENAAQAILSFSTNRAAALTGTYITINPATTGTDIWPGDQLALTANGSTINVIVRKVTVAEQGASPETLTYKIAFANDWAEGLGLQLSEAIAVDALLPQTALPYAPGTAWPVLANLQQLTAVASLTTLTIDAGTAPPTGGGFEVRRWDGGFGTGATGTASGDLVLRSPVRGFTIPRAAVEEKFFIRMYDASTPPL
jgi:hypothetical protein